MNEISFLFKNCHQFKILFPWNESKEEPLTIIDLNNSKIKIFPILSRRSYPSSYEEFIIWKSKFGYSLIDSFKNKEKRKFYSSLNDAQTNVDGKLISDGYHLLSTHLL